MLLRDLPWESPWVGSRRPLSEASLGPGWKQMLHNKAVLGAGILKDELCWGSSWVGRGQLAGNPGAELQQASLREVSGTGVQFGILGWTAAGVQV